MLLLVPGFDERVVQKVFQESGSFRPTSIGIGVGR